MDAAQYQLDVNATASGDAPDVYPALNVVMRRDAKENNFKVRPRGFVRDDSYVGPITISDGMSHPKLNAT
jgi:hypothetical protein